MSLTVALLAGALATLNPCGFAMLPAFLALYVGAGEDDLPRVSTRTMQGIMVGLVVTAGFLAVFVVLGLPVVLGVAQITDAVPWVGLALGVALCAVAVLTLLGRSLTLSVRRPEVGGRDRGLRAMLLFGVGYGLGSLGCTLPIFLVAVGASLATRDPLATTAVFAAYGVGMAIVLMALAVGAALLRDGVAHALRRLLPHLRWITGGLLLLAGGYLTYYWGSALAVSADARAGDPVVGAMDRLTAAVERVCAVGDGRWLLIGSTAVVVAALLSGLRRWVLAPVPADQAGTDVRSAAQSHEARDARKGGAHVS